MKIRFVDEEHLRFYEENMKKVRYDDVYHRALVYCLGISKDTREHIESIYDFKTGLVKPECLKEGWQTSGSVRVVRLGFNLYCNSTPSVTEDMKKENAVKECSLYNVEEIFCCSYAPYFMDAVKIRYPEYME